jgi:hypothetical protein
VRALCSKSLLLASGRLVAWEETGTVIASYVDKQESTASFSRPALSIDKPHVIAASVIEITEGEHSPRRSLKLRVTTYSPRPMSVEISALVRDNAGAPIGFAPVGSLMQRSPAQLSQGSTAFLMTLDVSILALGQYSLTLQISRPLGEVFDSCPDCLSFDIGSEHFSDVINPFRQDWQVGSVLFASTIERVQ